VFSFHSCVVYFTSNVMFRVYPTVVHKIRPERFMTTSFTSYVHCEIQCLIMEVLEIPHNVSLPRRCNHYTLILATRMCKHLAAGLKRNINCFTAHIHVYVDVGRCSERIIKKINEYILILNNLGRSRQEYD
jgi:hypothetical protein